MTNRFLISVAAAALIAGTGFANAQSAGGMSREGGAGSSAQQSAPSAGGGAAQHRDDSGMKSGQSEKAPGGKQAEDMKGGMKGEGKDKSGTVGQAPDKAGKDMKTEGHEGKDKKGTVGQAPDKSGTSAQGREDKSGAMGREDKSREDRMGQKGEKGSTDTNRAQQNQGTMDSNRAQTNQSGSQTTTTGNAATSARVAAPPAEKQTQIVSAIKSEKIQETNVDVNVAVGTVLPTSVHFVPLPPRIVEIYPEWRGYDVVLIHGRYVIVRPQTREIVYIIEG
jgi:Protein of unknown function (DUF1236)